MEATSMLPSGMSLTRREMLGSFCAIGIPTEVLAQAAPARMPSPDQFRAMELMDGGFAIQTSQLALEGSRKFTIAGARHKQVYIYGSLDTRPTELSRKFGMTWGLGGWLLFPFLQKIGPAAAQKLRERVVAELNTTFASHYTKVISLREALELDVIAQYSKRATGEKYLINPHKDHGAI
jgi:hypothetical protein